MVDLPVEPGSKDLTKTLVAESEKVKAKVKRGKGKRLVPKNRPVSPLEQSFIQAKDDFEAKTLEMQETIDTIQSERDAERKKRETLESELNLAQSKEVALYNVTVRNFAGVDYSKPAYAVTISQRSEDGQMAPAHGNIETLVGNIGGDRRKATLIFKKGICVTNDLAAARSLAGRGKTFSIEEVK